MSAPPTGKGEPIVHPRQLVEWFEQGCKPRAAWRIGTEHEKFAFTTADLRPLPYEGRASIRALLDRLADRFGWIAPARRRALARDWVERLKVKLGSLDQPVQELSGGNQQRIVLGKWLATEPKVLILDSPTVGVDVANKQAIHELVRALARQGMAILLISDEVGELWSTCDRVLVMRGGRITGELVPEEGRERALEDLVYA
jgi:simple sugar transport system ATP-binding protein